VIDQLEFLLMAPLDTASKGPVAQFLQGCTVRGREASEAGDLSVARIAICNGSFILPVGVDDAEAV